MADHENELVIGIDRDSILAKRFAGLQVEVLDPMAPQICPCRHCGGKPGGCPPEN